MEEGACARPGQTHDDSQPLVKKLSQVFATALALAAVAFSNGWHLPLLQGAAWVNMYGDYRNDSPPSV